MLKITLHDTPELLKFQLEGRLIGPWVREFEQCWRTAASIRGTRRAVVDLRDVMFIDDAGKDLLRTLAGESIEFIARDALTRAIVDDISSHASPAGGSAARLNPDELESIQKRQVAPGHSTAVSRR